ncbi:MAG: hypothetical protein KDB61_11275, partial [Planctomycetes bacterium]|nr:hypothetical protein [Planctomycetota bacterium]
MLTRLPDTYEVLRENQGTLALHEQYAQALRDLGYSVIEDGERHSSELQGRGNLQEFHLPSGQVLVIRR